MIQGRKQTYTEMMVFQSQLEEVERATPRDRIGTVSEKIRSQETNSSARIEVREDARGKISPMRTHAPGPQVEAKKKMKMAMKAT